MASRVLLAFQATAGAVAVHTRNWRAPAHVVAVVAAASAVAAVAVVAASDVHATLQDSTRDLLVRKCLTLSRQSAYLVLFLHPFLACLCLWSRAACTCLHLRWGNSLSYVLRRHNSRT